MDRWLKYCLWQAAIVALAAGLLALINRLPVISCGLLSFLLIFLLQSFRHPQYAYRRKTIALLWASAASFTLPGWAQLAASKISIIQDWLGLNFGALMVEILDTIAKHNFAAGGTLLLIAITAFLFDLLTSKKSDDSAKKSGDLIIDDAAIIIPKDPGPGDKVQFNASARWLPQPHQLPSDAKRPKLYFVLLPLVSFHLSFWKTGEAILEESASTEKVPANTSEHSFKFQKPFVFNWFWRKSLHSKKLFETLFWLLGPAVITVKIIKDGKTTTVGDSYHLKVKLDVVGTLKDESGEILNFQHTD